MVVQRRDGPRRLRDDDDDEQTGSVLDLSGGLGHPPGDIAEFLPPKVKVSRVNTGGCKKTSLR